MWKIPKFSCEQLKEAFIASWVLTWLGCAHCSRCHLIHYPFVTNSRQLPLGIAYQIMACFSGNEVLSLLQANSCHFPFLINVDWTQGWLDAFKWAWALFLNLGTVERMRVVEASELASSPLYKHGYQYSWSLVSASTSFARINLI